MQDHTGQNPPSTPPVAASRSAQPTPGAWLRLSKGDYLPAASRDDIDLIVLRQAEEVRVAPPLAGDPPPLEHYGASAVPIAHVHGATTFGPGFHVFTKRGELLRESVVRRAQGVDILADPGLATKLNSAGEVDHVVGVLGTTRANNYYHWWIDSLSRIWLVEHVLGHMGLTWLLPPRDPGFHHQTLALVGAQGRARTMGATPTRFTSVIFTPGLSYGAAQALSPLVTQFAGYLQGRIRPISPPVRRLYLSRGDARFRRVTNEGAVVRALADLGFQSVTLSSLTAREQAELFAGAEIVIGAHGAGLTNMLFAPPGTALIELFPDVGAHSSCYRHLASHLSQPYAALNCSAPQPDAGLRSDLAVDIDRLLRVVEAATACARHRHIPPGGSIDI